MIISTCYNCGEPWDARNAKCSKCTITVVDVFFMSGVSGELGYYKSKEDLRKLDESRRASDKAKLNPIYEARP